MELGRITTLGVSLSVWIFLVFLQGKVTAGSNSQCRNIVRYVVHSSGIQVKQSRPKINGEWASSGCEVRPGPKFLARHVTILPNSTYSANFHYYKDSTCSSPSFTISVRGFYTYLAIKKDDDVLEGATPTRFNFTTIRLYPHTRAMQSTVEQTAARSCPGTVHAVNATINGRNIFNVDNIAFRKRTCRDKFGVSEYEFSILKLEKRKGKGHKYDLLYFGEIQTSKKTKRRYKPTSYQMPLKKASVPNCARCTLVKRSSITRPPILPRNAISSTSTTLKGEWGSTTCETQPGLRFLTRYMKFDNRKLSWERQSTFFSDPLCQQAEFTLNEEGSYHKSTSQTFYGSTPYVFTVTAARMTPHDKYIKDILNTVRDNQCGIDNSWRVGEEQDITSSKGCNLYSISIPDTTYELVKYDLNSDGNKELYLGQKRTDETKFSAPSLRPTSFQIPLVECSAFPSNFVPPTTPPAPEVPTVFSPFHPPYTIPTMRRPKSSAPRSKKITLPFTRTRNTVALTAQADVQARYNAGPSGPRMTEPLFLMVISALWYLSWTR